MNTNFKSLLYMMVMIFVMASCQKSRDVEKILETVPSTTGVVVAADLETLLQKAGCDKGISPDMNKIISDMNKDDARVARGLLDGKAGVAPAAIAVFEDSGDAIATFYLDDEKKFMEFFRSDAGNWTKENGGYLASNHKMAIYKGQAWIFSRNGSMTRVKQFYDMGEKHSVLSLNCAERLTSDKDMSMLLNINKLINLANMPISESAQLRMAISTLFDNARYVVGTLELNKGEAEADFSVLNEDFKPASSTLELSALSKSELANFPGDASLIFGAALSKGAVERLSAQMSSLHLPADLTQMFAHVDGTILIGMSPQAFQTYSEGKGMGIMLTFDSAENAGKWADSLRAMGGGEATVTLNGKALYMSMDMPGGQLSSALVDALEGAGVGVAFSPAAMASAVNNPEMTMWKAASVTLEKDKNGMEVSAKIKSADSNANILATIIRYAAKAAK